ncbi:hypothetical protein N7523_005106 [Penicillium sp. IBT 18751x]|nr:hypothetical protein N7523_005106 [Penicillium sp. IBT 18751x]
MEQPTTIPDCTESRPRMGLMSLPAELHTQIASYLSYPDALALKHTSFHFNTLIYTGVHLKVDWLVERFERKLECPMEKCSFRTDEQFCNWRIRRIMERRRRHLECRQVPGGCCVVDGQTCRKVLIPWLKSSGPRKVTKKLWALGREGLLPVLILSGAEAGDAYSVQISSDNLRFRMLDGICMASGAEVKLPRAAFVFSLPDSANRTHDGDKQNDIPLTFFTTKLVNRY